MPDRSGKYLTAEAVEDETGELQFVSKSRVMQWIKNPEHFRLKYVEGYFERETAAMDRGTRIHDSIEHYYDEAIRQYDEHGLPPGEFAEYLPDDRSMWADFMPRLAKFFKWEHERIEHVDDLDDWRPISMEEEHWRHDKEGLPWEGTTDLILPAAGVPAVPDDEGVVIVDFKSGKTPNEKYRDDGIYAELAFYEMLFEDKYDVAGSGALFLKEGDFVVRPDTLEHYATVDSAVYGIQEALDGYDGGHFETNPGPLCCWGEEPGQRSQFYGICPCTWAVPVDNKQKFTDLCNSGMSNSIIADQLGTTTDAVSYWRYKLSL